MKVFRFKINGNQLVAFLVVAIFYGCSTTRYVPEDRYLLSDIDINIDNEQVDKDEMRTYLRQKENLRIIGLFKFHLWMYSLSSKKKEEGLLKNIGEEPVIYDMGLKDKSAQQLEQYLYNKGYYQALVKDTVEFRKKKAKVTFEIKTGVPYLIRNISYQINDARVSKIVNQDIEKSLLKNGNIFDVEVLEEERERVARLLKDEGFYKFAEEFIHYKIDTTLASKKADIEFIIENPKNKSGKELPHKIFTVEEYEVYIDNSDQKQAKENQVYSDTTKVPGYRFFHEGKLYLNQNLFFKTLDIKPGEKYTKSQEEKTYNNLYALKQFKYVNIQYHEKKMGGDSLNGVLVGKVFLPTQAKQNYSLDIEGTNKSGNLGIAGNVNYQHRNLLGGAEIFDVTLKGASERQITIDSSLFNTREYGAELKLSVPGLLLPVDEDRFNFYAMPFTSYSVAYNYQNRPDYTRTIVTARFGYNWKTDERFSHYFNLIDLNGVSILDIDPGFFNSIEDLYIASSYTDHIISASNYSLIYNDQNTGNQSSAYHYFRINLESAGNTLRSFASLTNREQYINENEIEATPYYTFFDTRFAQYIKTDIDYRYGYRLDKYNSFATRVFAGVAYPYGNFNVIPFEKRYFTGGANGIRAWQVRSIGPGSYSAGAGEYPNQSADIKLEANLEYRFKLVWMLEGAVFLDAGNIWAINEADNREGAVFHFDNFYKEIAIGTGFGLRLVSPYFILRTDLGFKLRDPALPEGQRFIHLYNPISGDDFNFNIAIGYPF